MMMISSTCWLLAGRVLVVFVLLLKLLEDVLWHNEKASKTKRGGGVVAVSHCPVPSSLAGSGASHLFLGTAVIGAKVERAGPAMTL